MCPPSLFLLTAFIVHGGTFSQQNPVEHGLHLQLPTLIRRQGFVALRVNGKSNELKLSPVPPEAEVGLPSPPVAEPLGTEYEVHEAPAAPHNFILQPVAPGTRPSGVYPSSSYQKPQVYGTNNHYFINQQGNLVQRPQRPQYSLGQVSSRPPPLNFNESPPVFPQLTDEELYMLGQPVQQIYQGNGTSSPEDVEEEASIWIPPRVGLSEAQSNNTDGFPDSIMLHSSNSSQTTPQPSTSEKKPTSSPLHPVIPSNKPSMTQNQQTGVYIATVNYGLYKPSLVYTCIPTASQVGYVQGPSGYSCKISNGRPSLASQILTANNQKPVTQPVVSTEPVSLPIVIPIKFADGVKKNVK